MTDGAPTPGGHPFPVSFGSTSADIPPASLTRRRKRRGLLLTAVGIVVIAFACAGIQLGANLGYDDALVAFETVAEDADDQQRLLESEWQTLEETTAIASKVAGVSDVSLLDAPLKDALVTALEEAESVTEDAASLREKEIPRADDKPDWAWELFGETAQLDTDREATAQLTEDFDTASSDTSEAVVTIEEAGISAVLGAAEASGAFEAAHVSARNLDIIALRTAAERVQASESLDDVTASAYVDLEAAAARMLTSERAEIDEKSGDLYDARVAVEAFARELAPGVLLDFDWSERVNGYGFGDSMGGYATWWYADPGYATIELSNSVARQWPSDRSKALVAHEVGHTISVKCKDMYDDSTQENIEAWATAWAISMGFHSEANGTSAYGAPPQSLIDVAAKCR